MKDIVSKIVFRISHLDLNFLRKCSLTILSRNPNVANRNSKNHEIGQFYSIGVAICTQELIPVRNFAS